jgi:hypothetical protein
MLADHKATDSPYIRVAGPTVSTAELRGVLSSVLADLDTRIKQVYQAAIMVWLREPQPTSPAFITQEEFGALLKKREFSPAEIVQMKTDAVGVTPQAAEPENQQPVVQKMHVVVTASLAPELVDELEKAHIIIQTLLNTMTGTQKLSAGIKLETMGIIQEGITRRDERIAVLKKAGIA